MIDVDDPRVRKILIFILIVATVYLVIAGYMLFMQSQERDRLQEKICDDLEKNPESIGIRVLGDSAYRLCECNQLENGTWNCIYSKQRAAQGWDKYRMELQETQLWK